MGRLVASAALGVAVVLTAPGARAQVRRAGMGGVDMQLRLDLVGQHVRSLPSLDDTNLKGGTSGTVSVGQPSTAVGFGGGADLVVGDRFVLPLVAFTTTFAVGRYPTVYATSAQHVDELRPWSASMFDVSLFGYGMRWKHRRWMAGFLVQPGLTMTILDVQRSDEEAKRRLVGVHGFVRATVEACRRLDPEERICLFGGPNVVLDRWFNGGVAGLRYEYGR